MSGLDEYAKSRTNIDHDPTLRRKSNFDPDEKDPLWKTYSEEKDAKIRTVKVRIDRRILK